MPYHGEFAAAAKDAADEAAGAREPDTFGFYGETFTIADRVGLMTLMQFAAVAAKGVDVSAMEGLAAMYRMLEDCLEPDEWTRFQDRARAAKATEDDLLAVVRQCIEVIGGRPTSPPSDSSAGRSSTTESSREPSSSPARTDLDEAMAGMATVGELAGAR